MLFLLSWEFAFFPLFILFLPLIRSIYETSSLDANWKNRTSEHDNKIYELDQGCALLLIGHFLAGIALRELKIFDEGLHAGFVFTQIDFLVHSILLLCVLAHEITDGLQVFGICVIAERTHLILAEHEAAVAGQFINDALGAVQTLLLGTQAQHGVGHTAHDADIGHLLADLEDIILLGQNGQEALGIDIEVVLVAQHIALGEDQRIAALFAQGVQNLFQVGPVELLPLIQIHEVVGQHGMQVIEAEAHVLAVGHLLQRFQLGLEEQLVHGINDRMQAGLVTAHHDGGAAHTQNEAPGLKSRCSTTTFRFIPLTFSYNWP